MSNFYGFTEDPFGKDSPFRKDTDIVRIHRESHSDYKAFVEVRTGNESYRVSLFAVAAIVGGAPLAAVLNMQTTLIDSNPKAMALLMMLATKIENQGPPDS